jgi:hypothetical protein
MTDKPTKTNEESNPNPPVIKPFVKKSPSPFNADPYNTRNNKNKAGTKFDKKIGTQKTANVNTAKRKGGSGGDR